MMSFSSSKKRLPHFISPHIQRDNGTPIRRHTLKDARLFLETTEDIFNSIDGFIDSFLNDYSYSEREQVYRTSRISQLNDDTVEDFRNFVQSVSYKCSIGLGSNSEKIQNFLIETREFINKNQSTLERIAGLLENRSQHFFGDDMDELKDWVECYLKRQN